MLGFKEWKDYLKKFAPTEGMVHNIMDDWENERDRRLQEIAEIRNLLREARNRLDKISVDLL